MLISRRLQDEGVDDWFKCLITKTYCKKSVPLFFLLFPLFFHPCSILVTSFFALLQKARRNSKKERGQKDILKGKTFRYGASRPIDF